jgi:hypothetical protein
MRGVNALTTLTDDDFDRSVWPVEPGESIVGSGVAGGDRVKVTTLPPASGSTVLPITRRKATLPRQGRSAQA